MLSKIQKAFYIAMKPNVYPVRNHRLPLLLFKTFATNNPPKTQKPLPEVSWVELLGIVKHNPNEFDRIPKYVKTDNVFFNYLKKYLLEGISENKLDFEDLPESLKNHPRMTEGRTLKPNDALQLNEMFIGLTYYEKLGIIKYNPAAFDNLPEDEKEYFTLPIEAYFKEKILMRKFEFKDLPESLRSSQKLASAASKLYARKQFNMLS